MEKGFIVDSIQEILDKNFSSPNKRRIIHHSDRINFACFYCGDSRIENKKRGNLYFNKLSYICFNCGKKTNLDWIIRENKIRISPEQKLELIEFTKNNIPKKVQEDFYETNLEHLIDLDELTNFFNSGKSYIKEFKPIEKGSIQYNYLNNRGITQNLCEHIYQAKYFNGKYTEDIIVLLNRRNNMVLGIQIRNIRLGNNRVFKIFNYEMLYRMIHDLEDDDDIKLDDNQLVLYNKLSYFFNILNVDFCRKITIFEGYIDSIFYPNSIGVVGTNTDFSFLENNELDLQYFFDNDTAGYKISEQKIKSGYSVFLWNKMFDHIVSNKKTDDPYKLKYKISKVKDLNELSATVPDAYNKLKLFNFFSKDSLDIMWLPKSKKYSKYEV